MRDRVTCVMCWASMASRQTLLARRAQVTPSYRCLQVDLMTTVSRLESVKHMHKRGHFGDGLGGLGTAIESESDVLLIPCLMSSRMWMQTRVRLHPVDSGVCVRRKTNGPLETRTEIYTDTNVHGM